MNARTINRLTQYFAEQERANHAASKQLGDGLTYVGGMGGNHNSGDEPFFPETARYECSKEPERHPNFRQKAKGEFVHRTAEPECVVGTTLLIAAGAGVGLLFAALGTYWLAELGAFVCGVVWKLFGGR